MYKFDEDKVIKGIKESKAEKVLLQLPEGLKKEALRIAGFIEKNTNSKVLISGDHCWGACDIALEEAKLLKADLLVHYGHVPFIKKVDFPVLYVEVKYQSYINPLIKKLLNEIKDYKKIGLLSSIQHLHNLEKVKGILEENNKEAIIPEKKGYSYYNGHILGCEYNSIKVIKDDIDCVVILGNEFHALGAALSIKKPVFLVDPYNQYIKLMDEKRDLVVKQRSIAISKVKDARKIGILVGLKPGQKFGSADFLVEELKKLDKEVCVITIREITPDKLMNFYDIDAFIELACPRIATEDYSKFEKPMITQREAFVVIGKMSWDKLLEEGIL